MIRHINYFVFTIFIVLTIVPSKQLLAEAIDKPGQNTRCLICGMFVAKYPVWLSQIHHDDGTINYFDGVKDLMVYYFNPEKYGGGSGKKISEIWTKDYYSLNWINAKKAFFVVGSDVYGPMGHEFVPFSSLAAAESFKKDHSGKEILSFEKITNQRVQMLRAGHKMK